MINLSHSVSGEALGRELSNDPEEAARALLEIAQRADLDTLRESLEDRLGEATTEEVKRLQCLAKVLTFNVRE